MTERSQTSHRRESYTHGGDLGTKTCGGALGLGSGYNGLSDSRRTMPTKSELQAVASIIGDDPEILAVAKIVQVLAKHKPSPFVGDASRHFRRMVVKRILRMVAMRMDVDL